MAEESRIEEAKSRAPVSQRPHTVAKPEDAGAIGATVTATIDGKEIKVPLGTTILDAAKELGIRIPTLCYHEDLCIAGVCRVCVVEIEGQRTLQASCAYPITQPIKVLTHSPKVRKGAQAHHRPAAFRALRRVLLVQPQWQLRTPGAGRGVRCRLVPLRTSRRASVRDRPFQPCGHS